MRPEALQPHPEGGRFREVFRSTNSVSTADARERAGLTHIYYELSSGERSGLHRVTSDEVWNLYRGALRLVQWNAASEQVDVIELSAEANNFCHVIPAGDWQAAEPISDTVLVGCSVGPGFDFDDFAMLDPNSEEANRFQTLRADLSRFIPSEP